MVSMTCDDVRYRGGDCAGSRSKSTIHRVFDALACQHEGLTIGDRCPRTLGRTRLGGVPDRVGRGYDVCGGYTGCSDSYRLRSDMDERRGLWPPRPDPCGLDDLRHRARPAVRAAWGRYQGGVTGHPDPALMVPRAGDSASTHEGIVAGQGRVDCVTGLTSIDGADPGSAAAGVGPCIAASRGTA